MKLEGGHLLVRGEHREEGREEGGEGVWTSRMARKYQVSKVHDEMELGL